MGEDRNALLTCPVPEKYSSIVNCWSRLTPSVKLKSRMMPSRTWANIIYIYYSVITYIYICIIVVHAVWWLILVIHIKDKSQAFGPPIWAKFRSRLSRLGTPISTADARRIWIQLAYHLRTSNWLQSEGGQCPAATCFDIHRPSKHPSTQWRQNNGAG